MKLSAQSLRRRQPITPFCERTRHAGVTYGLGPAGYDIRLDQDIWLWPGRYVLGSSLEHFDMPRDLLGRVCDKSTWARRGVTVQNTVIEPGWSGFLTLEIEKKFCRPFFICLRRGVGICQVLFERLDEPTEIPYQGKYQCQKRGPQVALSDAELSGGS